MNEANLATCCIEVMLRSHFPEDIANKQTYFQIDDLHVDELALVSIYSKSEVSNVHRQLPVTKGSTLCTHIAVCIVSHTRVSPVAVTSGTLYTLYTIHYTLTTGYYNKCLSCFSLVSHIVQLKFFIITSASFFFTWTQLLLTVLEYL